MVLTKGYFTDACSSCSSQLISWVFCALQAEDGHIVCTELALSCSSHFAFFVSTEKKVLSRHDSFDWVLDLRMTKIIPFLTWPVWVENFIMLTCDFSVLLCLAWPLFALSNCLSASTVSCMLMPYRHVNIPEHGSRDLSLDTEVGIMLYFLSAGSFPVWLDWLRLELFSELALIYFSDCSQWICKN